MKKNETAFVALNNIRVEIAEFEKQVTLADIGGLPLIEVEKRVVAEIAALATRGKPNFSPPRFTFTPRETAAAALAG